MAIDRIDILNRIKKIFEGLTQAEIARICGVTRQAVNRYFTKGILPNYDAMLRMAKYCNVSMEWLLTGKGLKEPPSALVREAKVLSHIPYIDIISKAQYKERLHKQVSEKECISIPLISESVAARDPLVIKEEHIEGFVCLYRTWLKPGHTYCCIHVRGDSMHPIISDGFLVAIDLNENNPLKLENQIVAARYHGRVTLRYLKLTEKEHVLLPHNTVELKPIVFQRIAPNPIIGKVAWWCGKQL